MYSKLFVLLFITVITTKSICRTAQHRVLCWNDKERIRRRKLKDDYGFIERVTLSYLYDGCNREKASFYICSYHLYWMLGVATMILSIASINDILAFVATCVFLVISSIWVGVNHRISYRKRFGDKVANKLLFVHVILYVVFVVLLIYALLVGNFSV